MTKIILAYVVHIAHWFELYGHILNMETDYCWRSLMRNARELKMPKLELELTMKRMEGEG